MSEAPLQTPSPPNPNSSDEAILADLKATFTRFMKEFEPERWRLREDATQDVARTSAQLALSTFNTQLR